MKVIALTGEAERCEQFIAALTCEHKVAIIRRHRENARTFVQKGDSDQLLCIKSPTRYALTPYIDEKQDQIPREVDCLGEREDVDFAVVVGGELTSRIVLSREIYEASWEAQ